MTQHSMSAEEWLEGFAKKASEPPPSEEELTLLLELAAVAAHASERIAAPVACWIAGRAGLPLRQAIEIAKQVSP